MDLKKIFKGLPDWNKIVNDNFDLINKRVEQDTGWIKASIGAGATTQFLEYRRIGDQVFYKGEGRTAKTGNIIAFAAGFRPDSDAVVEAGCVEGGGSAVGDQTVIKIDKVNNCMTIVYRTRADSTFSMHGISYFTKDPFPQK